MGGTKFRFWTYLINIVYFQDSLSQCVYISNSQTLIVLNVNVLHKINVLVAALPHLFPKHCLYI